MDSEQGKLFLEYEINSTDASPLKKMPKSHLLVFRHGQSQEEKDLEAQTAAYCKENKYTCNMYD